MISACSPATVFAALGFVAASCFPAAAAQCGGDFNRFLDRIEQQAVAAGIPARSADFALARAQIDPTVLRRDRAQGVFKQTFLDFSKRVISSSRLQIGRAKLTEYAEIFRRAERDYGVPAPVIVAFWGLETDYGVVQGDFNTINALATLSHDCRRPELFQPHLLGAIQMVAMGDLDPVQTTGAWAGEIGHVQMLPVDIIRFGVDGDDDGHVNVKESAPDAILTAANHIRHLGWQADQPWLQEVVVPPTMDWQLSGLGRALPVRQWQALGVSARSGTLPSGNLPADLLLLQGRNGPAFLAYPNFSIYLEWNKSLVYTTTAAYFATRLAGAERYNAGNPDAGLDDNQMKTLQRVLAARGHDVGAIDGILGAGTRGAVQREQRQLGLPADAWPTPQLLSTLQ